MQKFERNPVQVDFKDSKGLTEQSHQKACDINQIMKRYTTQELEAHVAMNRGEYRDMASAPTFHQAQNILAHGTQIFETIPAEIRAEFRNDMGLFSDWIQNPENRSEIAAKGFSTDHLPAPPETLQNAPNELTSPPKADLQSAAGGDAASEAR